MADEWRHWAIGEIRKSGRPIGPVDRRFLKEVEFLILADKPLEDRLEKYLLDLYSKHTEVRRSPKRLGPLKRTETPKEP